MKHTSWFIGVVAVIVGMAGYMATAQEKRTAQHSQTKPATTRPHESLGHMPLPIDQTIMKQNSAQDKLQIAITHSQSQGGKYVSYVRMVWGDLDNNIKTGGKEYYSNWDGYISIDGGTGQAVHRIAFDDGGRATTRPAVAHKTATSPSAAGKADSHPARHAATSKPGHNEPGAGSGRDELITASGAKIEWKAGVVGALDGLLIRITSDTPNVGGTIKAGNFTVPFKVAPGT